jgi:nucleotide-binding universal stress UspA family protein
MDVGLWLRGPPETNNGVMSHDWIVGVDGSPDSRAALSWAVAMASDIGGAVTPLTVWRVPLSISLGARHRVLEVDRLGLEAEAATLASATVDDVDDPTDVVGAPRVVEGHPARVLLAESNPESGVVVGRRGVSDLKHRLLGSVSQYLATHAHGPVVVVPASWATAPCRRIVVGFDGSDHAAAALRWTLDVAPPEAEVIALIAIDLVPWLGPELVEERYGDLLDEARQRLLAAVDEVDAAGRAERNVVLHGARQALASAGADADLIVVGPRGIGGVARSILGSVTTWLLHDAPCPVVIVPSQ